MDSYNPDLSSEQTYYNWGIQLPPPTISPAVITGNVTVVTTINGGGGGQATGPAITLGSNWNGVNFVASSGSVNLDILNAANARADLGAAKSGSNDDITDFTALTGNTGVNPWTGTASGGPFATYSGTASAGYVQAELQDVMDKLQETTEFLMFLTAALLAWGGVET
jgi:hypothetical protein